MSSKGVMSLLMRTLLVLACTAVLFLFLAQSYSAFMYNASLVAATKAAFSEAPVVQDGCAVTLTPQGQGQITTAEFIEVVQIYRAGCVTEALNVLQQFVNSGRADLYRITLADWTIESGDRDSAIDMYKLLGVSGRFAAAAELAREAGDNMNADEWEQLAFYIRPTREEAYRLFERYRNEGRLEQALGYWIALKKENSEEDQDYWLSIAMVACYQEAPNAAVARDAAREATETRTLDSFAAVVLGDCLSRAGLVDETLSVLAPVCLQPGGHWNFWACMKLGDRVNDPSERLRWYKEAQNQAPDTIWPLCGVASALNQQGAYTDTLSVFDLYQGPENPCSHYELAQAFWSLGQSESAINALRKGMEIDAASGRRFPGLWEQLGDWYASTNNVSCAVEAYLTAKELNSTWVGLDTKIATIQESLGSNASNEQCQEK